jgi:hypothetical protein
MAHNLQDQIAFRLWVPYVLKWSSRIIKAIKTQYERKTHKYGIKLPKTIEEAYEIDRETSTNFWHRAIIKEMKNNAVAFKFLEADENIPVGSKWVPFIWFLMLRLI